jgi:phosphate transport system substrate-binding protein
MASADRQGPGAVREEDMIRHFSADTLNRRRFAARAAGAAGVAAGLAGVLPQIARAQTVQLSGAGATFPAVLYSKWADEYARQTGVQINYQGIGSGGGIKAHQDMTTDFGATDAPMTDAQLAEARGGPTQHITTCLGAVVPTYNLPGVTTQLRFTGPLLADIFLDKVKTWNDPAIAAVNPGVTLPGTPITTVHRSDGSGTTFTFVDYLSKVSAEWKQRVGASTAVSWPSGLGAQGNPGVAGEVNQNPNSIGYVELAYAVQNRLGIGLVQNKAGAFPPPTFETVTIAAAGALPTLPDDLRVSITDADGERAWPISTFTWVLAYRQQRDLVKGRALADFLFWAITKGQTFASDLFYAPLPASMLPLVYSKIASLNVNGQPLLNPSSTLVALPRVATTVVDNGDGTATTTYSDGTSETYPIG